MNNSRLKFTVLCTAFVIFAGCGSGGKAPSIDVSTLSTIPVKATADVELPETASKFDFLPNNVASWTGHILILTESGTLLTTTSQGEPPRPVSDIKFSDATGIPRNNAAGVILGVENNGALTAFIEAGDAGAFRPLIVSSNSEASIRHLCQSSQSDTSDVWALTDSQAYKLNLTFTDEQAVTIDAKASDIKPPKGVHSCTAIGTEQLVMSGDFGTRILSSIDGTVIKSETALNPGFVPFESDAMIGLVVGSETAAISDQSSVRRLDIQDGLSIRGSDNVSAIGATSAAMGSTFNQGIVVLNDANENRLILISLDHISREANAKN